MVTNNSLYWDELASKNPKDGAFGNSDTYKEKVKLANQVQAQEYLNRLGYELENEFNSPLAQRQRLEEAGLNPYLMLNGGSAVANAHGGSASSPNVSSPRAQSMSNFVNSVGYTASTFQNLADNATRIATTSMNNQTSSDIALMSTPWADSQYRNMIYEGMTHDNEFKKYQQRGEFEKYWFNKFHFYPLEVSRMKLANDNLEQATLYTKAQTINTELLSTKLGLEIMYLPESLQNSLKLQIATIANQYEQGKLYRSQAFANYKQALQIVEETRGKKLSNDVIEKSFDTLVAKNDYDLLNSRRDVQIKDKTLQKMATDPDMLFHYDPELRGTVYRSTKYAGGVLKNLFPILGAFSK